MTLDIPESFPLADATKAVVKGRLRYFAPTQGRCEAYRTAFQQMMTQMKSKGIEPRHNRQYDFRVTTRDVANFPLNPVYSPLKNLATLDGTNVLSLTDNIGSGVEIFDNHNISVSPATTTTPVFSTGLTTQIGTVVAATDYVLQEGVIQTGNPNYASTQMESIPFVLEFDIVNMKALGYQWRPDPALYIPIMLGQMEIVFDEIEADGAPPGQLDGIEVNTAIHISGWKSILGSPKSRRSRKSNKTASSNDKKTSSKK